MNSQVQHSHADALQRPGLLAFASQTPKTQKPLCPRGRLLRNRPGPRVGTVLILPGGEEGVDLLLANATDAMSNLNVGVAEFDDATLNGFSLAPALACLSDTAQEDCSDVLKMVPAEWVLVLRIHKVTDNADSDQRVIAKMYDSQTADLLQAEQRVCQRCSSSERMASVIRELVTEMAKSQLNDKARDTFLDVRTTPTGAILSIDGVVVGATGQAYRVSPGEHVITVELAGYRGASSSVTVGANEHKAITVELDEEVGAGDVQRWLGIGAMGAGAVAVVIGGVQISRHEGAPTSGDRIVDRSDTMTQGLVGLGVGAGLVGLGAFLYFTAEDSSDSDDDVALTATPTTDGFSLGLSGRF